MAKRSIGASVSAGIEAVAITIESLPTLINETGASLHITKKVFDSYLTNWYKEKQANNLEEEISRQERLAKLHSEALSKGLTKQDNLVDFIKEMKETTKELYDL